MHSDLVQEKVIRMFILQLGNRRIFFGTIKMTVRVLQDSMLDYSMHFSHPRLLGRPIPTIRR